MYFNNDPYEQFTIKEMMQDHKKEKEAFREEMKKKMKQNHIDMNDFADNFYTMFSMINDIAKKIDPEFNKKDDSDYTKVDDMDNIKLKQDYIICKRKLKEYWDTITSQNREISKLQSEKEDLIKTLNSAKNAYEASESRLKKKIKILDSKVGKKNQLQEEVFNKERADLIQANSQLKIKYEKLQSEYDALKKAHVDLVQSITKLAKDNSEF